MMMNKKKQAAVGTENALKNIVTMGGTPLSVPERIRILFSVGYELLDRFGGSECDNCPIERFCTFDVTGICEKGNEMSGGINDSGRAKNKDPMVDAIQDHRESYRADEG